MKEEEKIISSTVDAIVVVYNDDDSGIAIRPIRVEGVAHPGDHLPSWTCLDFQFRNCESMSSNAHILGQAKGANGATTAAVCRGMSCFTFYSSEGGLI